jgi:hypothetical protein
MQFIKRFTSFCLFIIITFGARSQNFDYSVANSQSQFVFISDSVKTITDSTTWDDNTFQIAIGFPFSFAGQVFDSVKIRTNGTFTFDQDNKYNFVALYKNFISEINENGYSTSPITKELITLPDGNKRLKIEFQNALFYSSSGAKVHTNFQVWLNQQYNTIEFHMGNTDVNVSNEGCLMGLINMNGGGSALGYLLQGSTSSPTGVTVSKGSDAVQLGSIPPSGTTYIFNKN